jgi:flagellar motor switch protein FliM
MASRSNSILTQRNRKSDSILPFVERYFLAVADRFRSRHVNRSANDIPIRVAAVDATNIASMLANPEFRDSVVYCTIRIRGVPIEGCIMIQYSLLCRLLEVVLGGEGDFSEIQPQVRALSAYEQTYAVRVCQELSEDMIDAWPGSRELQITLNPPSITSPNWGPRAKTMEVLTATVDVGPLSAPFGLMSIALPVQIFERVFGMSARTKSKEEDDPLTLESVMNVRVSLVAELARVYLSLNDIKQMKEGMEIPLRSNMEVRMRVNGRLRFLGEFGERRFSDDQKSGMRSIRIIEPVLDDE